MSEDSILSYSCNLIPARNENKSGVFKLPIDGCDERCTFHHSHNISRTDSSQTSRHSDSTFIQDLVQKIVPETIKRWYCNRQSLVSTHIVQQLFTIPHHSDICWSQLARLTAMELFKFVFPKYMRPLLILYVVKSQQHCGEISSCFTDAVKEIANPTSGRGEMREYPRSSGLRVFHGASPALRRQLFVLVDVILSVYRMWVFVVDQEEKESCTANDITLFPYHRAFRMWKDQLCLRACMCGYYHFQQVWSAEQGRK